MTYVQKFQVTVTTPTTASSTSVNSADITGRIASIFLATSATFATTMDLTVTDDLGRKVLVEANTMVKGSTRNPVTVGHLATTGAVSSLAEVPIYLANQKLNFAVAQAGLGKTGTFTVIVA